MAFQVLLFYGERACESLQALLEYWDTILPDAAWNQYLFVSTQKSQLEPNTPHIGQCLFLENNEQLNAEDCATSLTTEVKQRIGAQSVEITLQCLAEAKPAKLAPQFLADMLGLLKKKLQPFSVRGILYLLLDANSDSETARILLNALDQRDNAYYVGNFTANGGMVEYETVLHATHIEMLANAQALFPLENGERYSIGYSTLNADNQELTRLLEDKAAVRLLKELRGALPLETAANLIMDRAQPAAWIDGNARTQTQAWLSDVADHEWDKRSPKKAARKPARVFCCLYEKDTGVSLIPKCVQKFFDLNVGTGEKEIATWAEEVAQRLVEEAKLRLSRCVKIAQFPEKVLLDIEEALNGIAENRPAPMQYTFPKPSLKERVLAYDAYIDRCCDEYEDRYERYLKEQLKVAVANALARRLEDLKPFLREARQVIGVMEAQRSPNDVIEKLQSNKYPKYARAIDEALGNLAIPIEQLFSENEAVLVSPTGAPQAEGLKAVWGKLAELLSTGLDPALKGSFWQTLTWEQEENLAAFFDNYLVDGPRLFMRIGDTSVAQTRVYVADRAFHGNPWLNTLPGSARVLFASNDNIDKIVRYKLDSTNAQLLADENNTYFAQQAVHGGIWKQGILAASMEPQATVAYKAAAPQEEPVGGLELIRTKQDRDLLRWNWENETLQLVRIYEKANREGEMLSNGHIQSPDYNTSGGYDITDVLAKYPDCAQVWVEIMDRNATIRVSGWVRGFQRKVEFRKDGQGGYELKGRLEDIRQVVMRQETPTQCVYYPVYALTNPQTYAGAPAGCVACVNPREQTPRLYIK